MGSTTLGIPYPDSGSNYHPHTDMAALAAAVDTLIAAAPGAWASYVPVWSSSGTAPALGNGTLTGRWVQIGKTVHAAVKLVAGSTTTFGTGGYSFTLPVAAATNVDRSGSANLTDASAGGGGHYVGTTLISTGTPTVFTVFEATTHAQLVPAGPAAAWAVSDSWTFSLTYEVP